MKPGYNSPAWAPYQIYASKPLTLGGVPYDPHPEYASYTEADGPERALEYCLQEFPKSEGYVDHACRNLKTGLLSRLATGLPIEPEPERTALPL